MALWILANDILAPPPLGASNGAVVWRAGRTVDDTKTDLPTLRSVGAILYANTVPAQTAAARLLAQDARGNHGDFSLMHRIDSIGPYLPQSAANATQATIAHAASPYTALATDVLIECDVSGGVITVNMEAAPIALSSHETKNSAGDASVNNITVSGNGNNIESPSALGVFAATATIAIKGASVTWQFDGSQWVIV